MLRRLFPHPLLTLALTLTWLALVNTVSLGNVLLGLVLAIAITALTGPYWPDRPRVARPLKMAEYALIVLYDIVMANIEVALVILFRRNADIHSHWVTVPLELTSSEAITVLAGTITMTPGTISTALSADGGAILVHCLHTDDPEGVRESIKSRYEQRLKEIFP